MNKPVDLGDILNQLETTEKQDKDRYNHVDTILQTKAEKFALEPSAQLQVSQEELLFNRAKSMHFNVGRTKHEIQKENNLLK
jgi:hypothetical protein